VKRHARSKQFQDKYLKQVEKSTAWSDVPSSPSPVQPDQALSLSGSKIAKVSYSQYGRSSVEDQETVVVNSARVPRSMENQETVSVASVRIAKTPFLRPRSPFMEDQDTVAVAAQRSIVLHKVLGNLPLPVKHVIVAMLTRMRDAQPEVSSISYVYRQEVTESQSMTLGWLPMVALTSALGLFLVTYAYHVSLFGGNGVEFLYLLGLLLVFAPTVVRLLSPSASRFERICLLYVVGICFYLVQVTASPLHFSSFNEFLHWRTADDIARSGHLFTENSMLPVSPYYPGLEVVTNALSMLSGLNTFYAGLIVVGVARLVMVFSLFMLYEQVTKSARMAGIATILYMTNPHFLSFDAQFSYESIALPLATFMLVAMARYETLGSNRRWMLLTAWIALGAVVATHHVTDFVFDGFLVLWVASHKFQRPALPGQVNLAVTALFGVLASLAYVFLINGNPVVVYLSSYFGGAFNELGHVVTGTSTARKLFVSYSGQPTPIWDQFLTLSSVAIVSLCLPFGWLCLWQRHHRKGLACMLGVASLAYPLSQAFRFTNFGSEITDRSAAFLFIPMACMLALFITQFWPTRWLNWKQSSLITCAIVVVFLGGVILQSGPALSLLPGPYMVSADNRSIEPEGIQAAIWSPSYLGPDNRIATDRINRLLMSTYGDQRAVTNLQDKVDTSPVFYASSLGPNEVSLLRLAKVRYVIVDLRLSTSPPLEGVYFEDGEPGSYHRTTSIPLSVLTKFSSIKRINRVFDSGNIVIYDVGRLTNAA